MDQCLGSTCVWESLATVTHNESMSNGTDSWNLKAEKGTQPADRIERSTLYGFARTLVSCGLSLSAQCGRSFRPRMLLFITLITALTTPSCGTKHATLVITTPATATAGTPFTITVTAMYAGKQDTVINSIVQFTSSDSAAVLPGYYHFTSVDAGSHTWTNGVTLMTAGTQTINATMLMESGISGTVSITVSPPASTAQF